MSKTIYGENLVNDYNAVSTYCHSHEDPVFIKEGDGKGLVLMSIDCYEKLTTSMDLYKELILGLQDMQEGRVIPADVVMEELRKRLR